jgi:hypothetical protein
MSKSKGMSCLRKVADNDQLLQQRYPCDDAQSENPDDEKNNNTQVAMKVQ